MAEENKVDVKLSDSQLNRLKSAANNRTGVILRMNIKMFNWIIYLMSYYYQQDKKNKVKKWIWKQYVNWHKFF